VKILETERLVIREMDSAIDAEFIFEILNTPKFIKYIGDRGVRSVEQASEFIENRYRAGYREHGFGLYAVELRKSIATAAPDVPIQIGMCGFVKRTEFEYPDLGFAFLPEFEGRGFGFESAKAMLDHGRNILGFSLVFAITSLDNERSGRLLEKLGFQFDGLIDSPENEKLRLFKYGPDPENS